VELGGPYSFYAEFRRAHGLMISRIRKPPEIALQGPHHDGIPFVGAERTGKAQEVSLTARCRQDGCYRAARGNPS